MKEDEFVEESRKILEEIRRRYGFQVPDSILKKRRAFDDPELDVITKVLRYRHSLKSKAD